MRGPDNRFLFVRRLRAIPLVVCGLFLASSNPSARLPRQPRLLDSLYAGDFQRISDSNDGRVGLAAVMASFSKAQCVVRDDRSGVRKALASVAYTRYLGSDSETGKYPSQEFFALGVTGIVAGDLENMFVIHGNYLATAAEIDRHGCESDRIQTIGRNFIRLLDERIAWHAENRGRLAPLQRQTLSPVTRRAFQEAIDRDVSLRARERVLALLDELEARDVQFRECIYGPTKPDGTGSETVAFWNAPLPVSTVDLMTVSRKHPLLGYGDEAISECPGSLPDARSAQSRSEQLGRSRVAQAALPGEFPLEQVLGGLYGQYQSTKLSWLMFKAGDGERFLRQAIIGKENLIRVYSRSCDLPQRGPGDSNALYCQASRELTAELAAIPDSLEAAATAGRVSAPAPAARPSPPVRPEYGPLPVGAIVNVQTLEPIDVLERSPDRRYRARLTTPIGYRGQLLAPVGTEVLLRVQPLVRTGATAADTYVGISAVSIILDGQAAAIQTSRMTRPVPVPGSQYRGPSVLRVGTPFQFRIGPPQ